MKTLKKFIPIYVMLLPGFFYLLINNYIPMAGLAIAFKDVNFSVGILQSDWIGLKNFEYLFKTPDAFRITRNTLGYNFAFIIVNLVVSVTFAVMLSEIRRKMAVKLYQTVILLPYMISMVIVSYLGYAFLAGDSGLLNGVRGAFVMDKISWYGEPKYWPFILIFINCWKGAGYTIITMILLSIGRVFYSDFGLFYQVPMESGALLDVTNTIDTYVYRGLITIGDIGMSYAAGVYQSLVGFVLVLGANFLTRRFSNENALF